MTRQTGNNVFIRKDNQLRALKRLRQGLVPEQGRTSTHVILLISLLSHLALIHSTRLRQHENQFISAINVNNCQLGEPVAQLRRMSLADSSLMKTSPTVDVLSERLGLKKIKLEEI